MLSLAYVSRAHIGPYSAEMLDIARVALRENAAHGVTGALYFDDAVFFQVIEGPPSAVEALFAAIRRDRRHGDVRLIDRRRLAQRRFGRWDMKFIDGARRRDLRDAFVYEALAAAHPSTLNRCAALMAEC
ncbi:MAG: BLUF domain-containing protein [Rhodobacteraceae bacterium]|nr:MAG: BLUF domain-containing protein [Paracoccaceae bacterium]